MTTRDERARRALGRAGWTGAVVRLVDMPAAELVAGTPGALIGLVRELTLAAWAMRGDPIPDYARADMPGRVIRATDAP